MKLAIKATILRGGVPPRDAGLVQLEMGFLSMEALPGCFGSPLDMSALITFGSHRAERRKGLLDSIPKHQIMA